MRWIQFSNRQNFLFSPNTCRILFSFDLTLKLAHLSLSGIHGEGNVANIAGEWNLNILGNERFWRWWWRYLRVDVLSDWLHFSLYFGATYDGICSLCTNSMMELSPTVLSHCCHTHTHKTPFQLLLSDGNTNLLLWSQNLLQINRPAANLTPESAFTLLFWRKTRRRTLCCYSTIFWSLGWALLWST